MNELKQFEVWFDMLSPMDKMNFLVVVDTPNALEKLPAGKYRVMAEIGQEILKLTVKLLPHIPKD